MSLSFLSRKYLRSISLLLLRLSLLLRVDSFFYGTLITFEHWNASGRVRYRFLDFSEMQFVSFFLVRHYDRTFLSLVSINKRWLCRRRISVLILSSQRRQ